MADRNDGILDLRADTLAIGRNEFRKYESYAISRGQITQDSKIGAGIKKKRAATKGWKNGQLGNKKCGSQALLKGQPHRAARTTINKC